VVNTNVVTSTHNTALITPSPANSRSRRGENCCDASCSATTTSVKVRAVTAMTEPATASSRDLAESASPDQCNQANGGDDASCTRTDTNAQTKAARLPTAGHSHSGVRERSASGRPNVDGNTGADYPRPGCSRPL
jgi:hypothetical protein